MELLVVGCNHRTAPIEVRESLVFAPEHVRDALRVVREENVLRESMILSTCNRTEFYTVAPQDSDAERYVRQVVSRFKCSDGFGADGNGYTYRDRETVRHLLRVSAGLDSMSLGEAEILGQVKDAYTLSLEGGAAGVFLNRMLAAAFRVGKRARTETGIATGAVSIASASVSLAKKIFADLARKRVLLVGAGETGQLVARHFAKEHPRSLLIANRTPERAEKIAAELEGEPLSLRDIAYALSRVDVVVCATRSPGFLIDRDMVRTAMKQRPADPLVLIDIAVPRDVDTAVGRLDNVFLYPMEALKSIVDQNLARRVTEVPLVEKIVEEEVERFFRWQRSLALVPLVRQLRERFESIREEELRRHAKHFKDGDLEKVETLTRAILNKLLHRPVTRIKALDPQSDEGLMRLDTARELFGLEVDGEEERNSGET